MKLEVGEEYWFKGKVKARTPMGTLIRITDDEQDIWTSDYDTYGLEAVEVIQEREKVTIPKEVADFINGQKNLEHGVLEALEEAHLLTKLDVINWLKPVENQEKFLKAWIYGYEIEKEPLYTVEIPDPHGNFKHVVLRKNKDDDVVIDRLNFSGWKKEDSFKLTEEEIKRNHEWAWRFAVHVEEEE